MPASLGCFSRARSVVIASSLALALGGWGVAAGLMIANGAAAGVDPVFIFALTVGCCFTITGCHSAVMPDKVKLYGLGFRDGVRHESDQTHDPEPRRHLSALH